MLKHFINTNTLVFPCIYELLVVFVPNLELFREIQGPRKHIFELRKTFIPV
jgi:hypothetical protein